MELRDYLLIIGRRWVALVVTTLVVTGAFLAYAATRPVSYQAVASYSFIKKAETAPSENSQYHYDAYYALQSDQLLASLASGWLAEPNNVANIYTNAHVVMPGGDFAQASQLIKTQTLAGASLDIVTKADTAAQAMALASATTTFVKNRVAQLETTNSLGPITVLATDPVSQQSAAHVGLTTAVGVVVGLILGLILVFLIEYLKPSTPSTKR